MVLVDQPKVLKHKCDDLAQLVLGALKGKKHLLLGLSGGLDSVVLLHLLHSLYIDQQIVTLRACHIHHGLCANADLWEQFCKTLCQSLSIEYYCFRVHILAKRGDSLEQAARKARYAAFAQHLTPNETLVTAHHLDDQCESVLLALTRGSGPKGLSAIQFCQKFSLGELCRPLLTVPRSHLLRYAQKYVISWMEDESNNALQFDRNFLRHVIIPQICQRWPSFAVTIARSALLCAQQEQLLDEYLQPILQQLLDRYNSLAIPPLRSLSNFKRDALLRRWFKLLGAPFPTQKQLQVVWDQVAMSRVDANPHLQLGNRIVHRFRQRLYLIPKPTLLPTAIVWNMNDPLWLPANIGTLVTQKATQSGQKILAPKSCQRVTVRFGLSGTIRIVGRGARQSKKIYQEKGIPPWLRQRLPVIYYDNTPITVPGILTTELGEGILADESIQVTWLGLEHYLVDLSCD